MILILIRLATPQVQAEDLENYTYKLSQSTGGYAFWTTPPSERVFKDDAVPTDSGSFVKVYAARNEFEPFLVVLRPGASGSVAVDIGDFGPEIETEIYQVRYVNIVQVSDHLGRTGPYPDPLWPIEKGESVSVVSGENTAFWFSVKIPKDAMAGDYSANVRIGDVNIPVSLHVFNFAIPETVHVKSQMNTSFNAILTKYGVSGTGSEYWRYVDKIKQFFIDHRLTPKSALWPGGLTSAGGAPYINYDCNGTLTDIHGIWGFQEPAMRYLAGTGMMEGMYSEPFNDGTGFPSFMAATFQNNDASADQRPSTFCGQSRSAGDWSTGSNPNSPYNQKWFQYMTALQNYLAATGHLEKAYYYFANEPQDQADYDAVAWYSKQLKNAAPNLKLMVSEEPKPDIFSHPNYTSSSQIDIWLALLNHYDPAVSFDRQANHNEETWMYWLHGTQPPYFNPITLDHPGIESKFTGWFLWKYRLSGLACYAMNNWGANPWTQPMVDNQNGNRFMLYPPSQSNDSISYGSNSHRFVPSIRLELMRDGLEDYEYLYVLNNNNPPEANAANAADSQAGKIIAGLKSYTRDSEFMYNLRRLIGQKNGNEIASIPDIHPEVDHPRAEGAPGNYYINFQDPSGQPTADPLIVDGKEYIKIGWNNYDAGLGYGWFGDVAHRMSTYQPAGPNVLQNSIIFDDWGRTHTFEFDLPSGTYNATVSVGWYNRSYNHHKITLEGVRFVDDEATTAAAPYIVRTKNITIADSKLTMEMGIFNEYTMLNYLTIEAAPSSPQWDFNRDGKIDLADLALFVRHWNLTSAAPSWDAKYDLHPDSVINVQDLNILASHWMQPCDN